MDLLSSYYSTQKKVMLKVLPSSLLINILSLAIPLVVLQICLPSKAGKPGNTDCIRNDCKVM